MSSLKVAAAVTVTAVAAAGIFKVVLLFRDWQRDRELAKLRRELERKERWASLKSKALFVGVVAGGVAVTASFAYSQVRRMFRTQGSQGKDTV